MAKCSCGSNNEIMSASDYRAWIQPCGSGKDSPKFPAMCSDSNAGAIWTNLEITNLVFNKRGTPTTIYRRSFENPCNVKAVKTVYSQPDDNTVDIQMDRLCGGVDVLRLQDDKFNLYLQHQCCCGSSTSFENGWSGAIDVIQGIDFSGFTIPNLTDTGNDTESELRIQLNGVTFEDFYTITELDVGEVAASNGMTTGGRVGDVAYYRPQGGCNASGGCNTCGTSCYAIAEDGYLMYSYENGPWMEIQVPELAAAAIGNSYISFVGDKIYITYSIGGGNDGVMVATIDSQGNPGAFTEVAIGSVAAGTADIAWTGITEAGNGLCAFGNRSTTGEALIVDINASGTWETAYQSDALTDIIRAKAVCGSQSVAVGNDGAILKRNNCGSSYSAVPSPTAGDIIAVDIRVEDEIYIGTSTGEVYCTTDCGENWQEVTAQFGGIDAVRSIMFVNDTVGYISGNDGSEMIISSTWDGGDSWTAADPRLSTQPDAVLTGFDVPCCESFDISANNWAAAGFNAAGQGVVYKGSSLTC